MLKFHTPFPMPDCTLIPDLLYTSLISVSLYDCAYIKAEKIKIGPTNIFIKKQIDSLPFQAYSVIFGASIC